MLITPVLIRKVSGPPPFAGFLKDLFTGSVGTSITAHTPDIGGAYALSPVGTAGDFQLDGSSGLFCSAISGGALPVAALNAATPPSADYTVSFDLREITVAGGGQGVMLRTVDRDNGYWLVHNAGANLWAVAARIGGSNVILGTLSDAIGAGISRSVTWAVSGNNHVITVIGKGAMTFTDSTFTSAGKVGYYAESAITSTTGDHIQNVQAA